MKNEPHKKRIALFMIAGMLLLGGIILKNIVQKITPDNSGLAVMYFSESITGLTVGSPVVYEGVQIGKVVKIEIITDPQTLEFSIPVYVRFAPEGDISQLSSNRELQRGDVLKILIDKGLRARLSTQNLLTGQLMIELLMLPDSPIVMKQTLPTNKHLFEIPTTLSTIAGLSRDLSDLPLKQIVSRFNHVLNILDTDLPPLLNGYTSLSEKLNRYTDHSVVQTDQTLNQINRTLKDVSASAKSLKNLTDYLEQHPDAMLKGKEKSK